MQEQLEIFYKEPATEWEETFPIGNGHLGGMIWGTVGEEKIGLNDEALWSGYPYEKKSPRSIAGIEKARQLILEGKRKEAQEVIEDDVEGNYTESYLPLGDLLISFDHGTEKVDAYDRVLDISKSLSRVSYKIGNRNIEREYFASNPEQAIFGRYRDSSGELSVEFSFTSELQYTLNAEGANTLIIKGQCPEHVDPSYIDANEMPVIQGTRGMNFGYHLVISETDGVITVDGNKLRIDHASLIVFYFSNLNITVNSSFNESRKKHMEDYQSLFNRVELNLGSQLALPMNERLERMRNGETDNGMIALYFQFGRYLMISGSREGGLPMNLQGIWSWEFRAPWSANYTTNINAEMNYWPADTCNLSECFAPYADFIKQISEAGRQTAKDYYGLEGSVMHHNTDRGCITNPVGKVFGHDKGDRDSVKWAYWPMGGAWYASDLYRHYEYTGDEDFLRETVYPVLRNSVQFLCGFLVDVAGTYHTMPSTSPENAFYDEFGEEVSVDKSTTMDISLIRENFSFFKKTCQLLDIKDELLTEVKKKEAKLAEIKIGSKGQLLEYQEEFREVEPGHRHFSHLYGFYPGEILDTDELKPAVGKSIEIRMANGGAYTGWSNAWLINLYAILGEGDKAYQQIVKGITDASYPNLWGKHPPFQIDSNFGVTFVILVSPCMKSKNFMKV